MDITHFMSKAHKVAGTAVGDAKAHHLWFQA
jgi:hypothetical protein